MIRIELAIVLLITFGMQGLRSMVTLARTFGETSTTIVSPTPAIYQVLGIVSQLGWGALGVYLLALSGHKPPAFRRPDLRHGTLLAAVIGLPGLVFYIVGVRLGLGKEVIPSAEISLTSALLMVGWAVAAAVAEESIVAAWLLTRLRQLHFPTWAAIACSALLRGSYHLYQGIAGGIGNIIMGVVFASYFHKTGRLWPLIIAHFLIDFVAFIGYQLLSPQIAALLAS